MVSPPGRGPRFGLTLKGTRPFKAFTMKKLKISSNYSVRLKDLAGPVAVQAHSEGIKPAKLIRRAVRKYISSGGSKNITSSLDDLNKFRIDFSRVGANLNQLAHYFNINADAGRSDLHQNFDDLRSSFKNLSSILGNIENEINSQLK